MPNYSSTSWLGNTADWNFPGSSGYGIRSDGTYGPLTRTPSRTTTPRTDYAVWNASTGRAVSILTGQPFSGVDPRSGRTYNQGQEVTPPSPTANIDPNNPNQRYRPVDIVRSPDVSEAQQNLMEQFRSNANSSLRDFGQHLNDFRADTSAAREASSTARNIAPTEAALTTAQQTYGGDLTAANEAYRQALADAAARERGIVTQAQDLLPSYDAAANAIAQQQLQTALGQYNRYKAGSGTPTSFGTSDLRTLGRMAQDVLLPFEREKINQRYNILTGMAMPTEERIAGRNIGYAGSFQPSIAGSRYGSATTLATTIQNLRQQVANMSYADAVNYLRAAGIPAEMQNAILAGQTGTLGSLAQLEEASRYRGLEDVLGAQVSQPVYYNMALPGYPASTPRYPVTGTTPPGQPGLRAPNAPQTVSPTTGQQQNLDELWNSYMLSGMSPQDFNQFVLQSNPRYNNLDVVQPGMNYSPPVYAGG